MLKETCEQVLSLFRSVEPNTRQSQGDFTRLKALPAIVLTGPRLEEDKRMRSQTKLTAVDIESLTYVKEKTPRWYHLIYDVTVVTETFRDLANRLESLSRLALSAPLLTAEQENTGRVRRYNWDWRTFPGNAGKPNFSGVYEATGRMVVWDVEIYSGVMETGSLITSVVMDFVPGGEDDDVDAEQETIKGSEI